MISRVIQAIARRLRRIHTKLDPGLVRFCSRSRFRAACYYFVWNQKFWREHQGVLKGRVKFEEASQNPKDSSARLRRNVHRIEKGLIMQPRRDVFALDYITETVTCYERAVAGGDCSQSQLSNEEFCWAHDVLSQYFSVTASHQVIDPLREKFNQLPSPNGVFKPDRSDKCAPYKRPAEFNAVSYDQMLALAKQRRSVRWFQDKAVPRELIEKATVVAGQSPSACNRQPFEFRVYDSPELIRKVAFLPAGTKGFDHNFKTVVVVVGNLSNYYDERDRHLIYIDGGLASMSFVFALETLGLSSCCINWPDIEERELMSDELLGLSVDQRPVMFIAVGYPDHDGLVPYSEKKPVHQLCRFNVTG